MAPGIPKLSRALREEKLRESLSQIAKDLPGKSSGRPNVIRALNFSDADYYTGSRDSVERWEQPTFCLADFQYCRRLFHGVIIRRLFFLEGSEGTRGIGRDTWHSTEGTFPHLRYRRDLALLMFVRNNSTSEVLFCKPAAETLFCNS